MRTRQFKKFSHTLLNQKIPENLLPMSGLSLKKKEKAKRAKGLIKPFVTKKRGSNLENQLYKSFAAPLIENMQDSVNYLTPNGIYSIDQINLELKKNRMQKLSDFGYQLQERKKLRWFYGGISTRNLRKLFKESYSKDTTMTSSIFQNLEKRLDVVLYRSGFFGSIYESRQWILNQRIYINDRLINRPSYSIQAGDIVTIQKKWHRLLVQNILERFLVFLQNVQLIENLNEITFPNIQNIALNESLHTFQSDKVDNLSLKSVKSALSSFANAETSRKFQKKFTNSASFRAFHAMKPQHLEVSYKTLSFIYLYPPQKIEFPTLLNVSAIEKTF